jgi:hypothetical protein
MGFLFGAFGSYVMVVRARFWGKGASQCQGRRWTGDLAPWGGTLQVGWGIVEACRLIMQGLLGLVGALGLQLLVGVWVHNFVGLSKRLFGDLSLKK